MKTDFNIMNFFTFSEDTVLYQHIFNEKLSLAFVILSILKTCWKYKTKHKLRRNFSIFQDLYVVIYKINNPLLNNSKKTCKNSSNKNRICRVLNNFVLPSLFLFHLYTIF